MTNIRKYVTPPRSLEIEKRVLGALIFIGKPSNLALQQAMLSLDSDSFYCEDTKLLFQETRKRFYLNKDFDFVSLSAQVDTDSVMLFESLREDYYTPSLLESDVDELNQYRTLRRQLIILVDAINLSLDEKEPEAALAIIATYLQKLSQSSCVNTDEHVQHYEQCIDEALNHSEGKDSLIYIDIPDLPPVPNRSLITIAGRSGHGKTFFALYMMDKIIDAMPSKQTLYFNLEMHPTVMLDRHAMLLGIQGNDAKERISKGAHILLPKDVSLISVPLITIDEIESICRIAAIKKPLGVVVVDYLGLVTSKSKSERKDLEQNNIAKRLAAISIDLNCIVICLIQVNREFRQRQVGERCPIPTDASEAMGSVHSSSWWIGIDQPYLDNQDIDYLYAFQVMCRKNRTDSGLFKLDLQFKQGMFQKRFKPFSPSYHVKREEEYLVP